MRNEVWPDLSRSCTTAAEPVHANPSLAGKHRHRQLRARLKRRPGGKSRPTAHAGGLRATPGLGLLESLIEDLSAAVADGKIDEGLAVQIGKACPVGRDWREGSGPSPRYRAPAVARARTTSPAERQSPDRAPGRDRIGEIARPRASSVRRDVSCGIAEHRGEVDEPAGVTVSMQMWLVNRHEPRRSRR